MILQRSRLPREAETLAEIAERLGFPVMSGAEMKTGIKPWVSAFDAFAPVPTWKERRKIECRIKEHRKRLALADAKAAFLDPATRDTAKLTDQQIAAMERKARIVALVDAGRSRDEIAAAEGISAEALRNFAKYHKFQLPPGKRTGVKA